MTAPAPAANLAIEDIAVGESFSVTRAFTQEDVRRYAELTGDFSPLHMAPEYAATTEFGGCVVHGLLVASLFSQLVGMRIPGRRALYTGQDLAFRKPVMIGETVTATAKVTAINAATGTIQLATEIRSAAGALVTSGTAKVKVRADGKAQPPAAKPSATPVAARPDSGQRVALVTGGSRGIGAAISRALARKGFAVAVNYHSNTAEAEKLCRSIADAGGKAVPVQADVRDETQAAHMIDAARSAFGALSLVVNGATGPLESRPAAELDWSQFEAHLDYQLKAAWQTCKAAYPFLKASGHGAVVNILSQVVAGAPPAGMAAYTAAKFALLGLSKTLAVEWAGDGIRVNAVSPSLVQTELTSHYKDLVFRMEASRTPLKRLATPEDIANAVLYLAGDEAAFLTGVNLFVAGGQVMD